MEFWYTKRKTVALMDRQTSVQD